MPMFVLVRQILRVDTDDGVTVLAGVGKHGLVALDAVRMVILQDISLTGQGVVALPAAEVTRVPVFRHGLRVLPAENELVSEFPDLISGFLSPDQ